MGGSIDEKPTPLAPAPYVVLRVGTQELSVLPVKRTYAPRWSEAIALTDASLDPNATAVLQVMDDVDGSLLGQTTLPVSELLATGTRTLIDVGAIASLTLTVVPHERREPIELDLKVPGNAAVRQLPFVDVWNGDQVEVTARGNVCPSQWDRQLCVGPDGTHATLTNYNLERARSHPHAALIAVMADGVALVGAAATLTAEHTGRLYFRVNDNDAQNNTGAFELHVRVVPGTAPR